MLGVHLDTCKSCMPPSPPAPPRPILDGGALAKFVEPSKADVSAEKDDSFAGSDSLLLPLNQLMLLDICFDLSLFPVCWCFRCLRSDPLCCFACEGGERWHRCAAEGVAESFRPKLRMPSKS